MLKWMKRGRLAFWLAYLRGRALWDTNVTPPELVQTIEGPCAPPPGRALDLGCGTGTNVIYLAQRGWEAAGVDFVNRAVRQARKKARRAGVTAEFYTGDVTQLDEIKGLNAPFDLALDIGCFHSLTSEQRARYTISLIKHLRPGATYVLYAWGSQGHEGGLNPKQIEAAFAPHLHITRIQQGEERGRPSAWYWFTYPVKNELFSHSPRNIDRRVRQ